MKKHYLYIICISFCLNLNGQDNNSIDNLLDKWLNNKSTISAPLTSDKLKSPIFSSYELRTETNDFDFDEQEYLFRVTPVNPKQRKAQFSLFEHYKKKQILLEEKTQNEFIEQFYEGILKLYSIDENIIILDVLDTVYAQQEAVISKQMSHGDINYSEFLKTRSAISDAKLNRVLLNQERIDYVEFSNISTSQNWDEIISVDQILLQLDNTNTQIINPTYLYKKEGIEKELILEDAESKQLFDFGQIRYKGPHSNIFEERINVGLGIQLSTSGARNLKMQKLKMEMAELDWENDIEQQRIEENLIKLKSKIKRKITFYNAFTELKTEEIEKTNQILNVISKQNGVDPLAVLKNKEQEVKNNKEKLNLYLDILEDYISYLKASGLMFERPLECRI